MSKNWKIYKSIQKSYRGIIVFIVIGILLVNILTVYSYTTFRDNLISKEQEQLLTIATSTSKTIEDFLDEKLKDSTILVQTIVDDYHTDLSSDEITAFISYALNNYYKIQNGKVYQVQYFDEYSDLIYSTVAPEENINPIINVEHFEASLDESGPVVSEIFELSPKKMAFDITTPVVVDHENKGYLRVVLTTETIYKLYVQEIKIGSKGYASIKDSDGVLIMHPKNEDIGVNVMVARKSEFPDYDWSELEGLVEIQKKGESGTGIYHSIWYQDEIPKRVKKFSAFAPINVGDHFWVVTVSMDYKELSDLATNYFYINIIIIGLVPIFLIVLLIYILNLRRNISYLENEQMYIGQVSDLNKELEKDIEERKELEKALYASKERFKQLFNAGSDLTFVLNRNDESNAYEIIRVNDMACIKLGSDRKELIGVDFLSLNASMSKQDLDEYIKRLEQDELSTYESELILDNGQQSVFEMSGQVFLLEGQTLMMLMARDITKKKAQEEQLEKNRALLIYKFRLVAMGEMIANIAHQWRQPLGSLSLMISNLDDAYEHDDLDEVYFKETINNSQEIIQKMSTIIDDFRYFFNPRQEKSLFDLEDQIKGSIEMVKDRIKIGEVDVQMTFDSNRKIYGYPNQLSQVVLNIINNSLDAMKENTNKRVIKIHITDEDNNVLILIANNGHLMPDETIKKVFDPYFTTKSKEDGTGIGLYMTKMIIESNFEGSIEMYNKETTVVTEIRLPIEE